MKKLLQDEPSADELVIIWKSQAFEIATISKTPDPVGRFLESKRIPKHEASVAAILIWNEAQKSRIKGEIPWVIIGLCIFGFGLVVVAVGFWLMPLLVLAGLGPVVLGAAILWRGYADRR